MTSWNRTRSFFPVTRELVYLNHAGVAPISTRVEDALRRYSAEATGRGAFDYTSAYDAEIEANPSPDQILARTALRAVRSHGATEREIAVMGEHPTAVLNYIRTHGNPPACAGFVGALERAQ